MSFFLILVTIFDGFKVTKSPLFVVIETILNLMIGIDFTFRLKLTGKLNFFTNSQTGHLRWWNIFDAMVVLFCTLTFIFTLIFRGGALKALGETSEEILLVLWAFL